MTTEHPTLQQTIQTAAAHHDAVSAEIKTPEVRVYETKTSRMLANGEIREYIIKQHYVVKKKTVQNGTQEARVEIERRNYRNVAQSRNTSLNPIKRAMPTIKR